MSYEFDPDWVIAPGETLKEWMDDAAVTVHMLHTMTNRQVPVDKLQAIIDGKGEITEAIASYLFYATGIPSQLWLNLERMYRTGLAAGKVRT